MAERCPPFNPLSRHDRVVFEALLSGEHALHGFTNRDLRHKLTPTPILSTGDARKQSAQVTRLLPRLHAHRLIAKIPHSRRRRVSLSGRRVMAAALKLREVAYPSLYAEALTSQRIFAKRNEDTEKESILFPISSV